MVQKQLIRMSTLAVKWGRVVLLGGFGALLASGMASAGAFDASERIRPYEENPRYWQYAGEPVLLLGGSWQDNLFNHPTRLAEHLDILTSVGGNYVRCTMSSRNAGNVWAFKKGEGGKYDLSQWNPEYWERFERFLELTHERDIIVQIEIWDPWDFFEDHQTQGGWSYNPFNPANNVTYTADAAGMPTEVDYAPGPQPSDHPFFRTVPELQNNRRVLQYQEAYVDRLMEISLEFPHVLYCINNESGERLEWSEHWIEFVHKKGEEAGREVEVTDMRRNTDITAEDHRHIHKRPERYSFVDISQNNTRRGQLHWDRIQQVRELTQEAARPLNNVKIYTFNGGPEASVQRFWRIVFGGSASARFHRPHPLEHPNDHLKSHGAGIGLSPQAQAHIRSLRMLTDSMNVFRAEPHNDLLSNRAPNEAYCFAQPGRHYAVYFPNDGEVGLDLNDAAGRYSLRWLDIRDSTWQKPDIVDGERTLSLEAPGEGPWAVLLSRMQGKRVVQPGE